MDPHDLVNRVGVPIFGTVSAVFLWIRSTSVTAVVVGGRTISRPIEWIAAHPPPPSRPWQALTWNACMLVIPWFFVSRVAGGGLSGLDDALSKIGVVAVVAWTVYVAAAVRSGRHPRR